MKRSSVYYLDAGIVNNVGHNLETLVFLKTYLGHQNTFTVIAGKRFTGSIEGIKILPLLRYGSPHWSMPSQAMRYLQVIADRVQKLPFDVCVRLLKAHEVKQDLSTLSFEEDAEIIINSMELDDAWLQCEALWALQPSLRIKVILHYSPFLSHATVVRPKLSRAVECIRKLPYGDHRVAFYADTDKLCQIYAALLNRSVTLLPIPHAKRGGGMGRPAKAPYHVTYFGTYSETKSPHIIPEIVRRLSPEAQLSWSVYITYIAKNPVINALEDELRDLENQTGKAVYHVGPFSTQQVDAMFDQSDIFLIPYHAHDYEIQSSGVVMEALVSGKIPVISRSMADAGLLEAVDPHLVFRPNNETDIVANLEYIVCHIEELQDKLRPLREKMEAFHTPQSFVKILLG